MSDYTNSGHYNSGNYNSGNRNSGEYNSGHYNSRDYNSGNCNSGNRNSGEYNSGHYNSGNCNSGNRNSGNRNSGNRNSGNRNSGEYNSGHYNSGNCNSGNRNSGMFNTDEPNMRSFNKESNIKFSDFIESGDYPSFGDFEINIWISESMMTEEEKKENPTYGITGGFLKQIDYKEAWSIFWRKTSEDNKKKFLNLPNFDPAIFMEITGIDVTQNSLSGKKVRVEIDGVSYSATID